MVSQGRAICPVCCVWLLPRCRFGGCGCVLASVAAVLVDGHVVSFGFGCPVVVVVVEAGDLAVAGLEVVGFPFHGVLGEGLGRILLLLVA